MLPDLSISMQARLFAVFHEALTMEEANKSMEVGNSWAVFTYLLGTEMCGIQGGAGTFRSVQPVEEQAKWTSFSSLQLPSGTLWRWQRQIFLGGAQ